MELAGEKEILKELEFSLKKLREEKDKDIRFALYNYIQNLLGVLKDIGSDYSLKRNEIFKDAKDYRKFNKKDKLYRKRFNDNFCYYKDFHSDYLNDILVRVEPLFYKKIDGIEYSLEDDKFSEEEFLSVLHDFCNSIGLSDLLNNMLDKKILSFDRKISDGNYLGLMIHNPLNGNSNILVDAFSYNIDSMFTLVHELGHVYDTSCFNSSINVSKYNDYMYKSLNVEVISKLFEKLFLDYLIKNNIKKGVAVDKLIDSFIIGHDYLFSLYAISLLEDKYIYGDRYQDISKEKLFELLGKYFENKEDVFTIIRCSDFDLIEDSVYAYGDIFSLFLKEYVSDCCFDSSLEFNRFMESRFSEFSDRFIINNGFSPSKYEELYKKNLELIKK